MSKNIRISRFVGKGTKSVEPVGDGFGKARID
jgi:hypothetical protein